MISCLYKSFTPPLRRFFYVCLAATAIGFGCRAVNAEPVDSGFKSQAEFSTKAPKALKGGDLVAVAERYVGSRNPTGHGGAWCGHFLNLVLRRAGLVPMPGNRAIDALRLGPRVARAVPGSLIVRRHHVEISLGDGRSISGNWRNRVAIHPSSRGIIIQPSKG